MPSAPVIAMPTLESHREDAWHTLGPTLPDCRDAAEAMKLGRLSGWNVRKVPLTAQVGDQSITVPGQYAVVRDNPWQDQQVDVLGTVGDKYHLMQFERLAPLLDRLQQDAGARYESAGELDGGRRMFLTMKLPGVAKVGGVDPVENYIAIVSGHDGRGGTQVMVTPVRVKDRATLNMAYQGHDYQFNLRHTQGVERKLAQQVPEALGFAFNYLDAFQEEADRLLNTPLSQAQFEHLLESRFGAPRNAPAPTVTRTQNKLDHMAELFADHYDAAGVGGTAWAGLAALAEWHDYHSPVRGAAPGEDHLARSRKALLDPDFKHQAHTAMMELTK